MAEPATAHFEVSSRFDKNSLYLVLSEKKSVVVPFAERQPSVVHPTHPRLARREIVAGMAPPFPIGGVQGNRYPVSAARLILMDYLSPNGPPAGSCTA
jgi:hypothetical protein